MVKSHDDVLEGVRSHPGPVPSGKFGNGVEMVDERVDRWSVRGVDHLGRRCLSWVGGRRGLGGDGLGVGRVVARGAAHEGVLAGVERREELLGVRAAHRARHGRHDHVGQSEAIEGGDVGDPMHRIGAVEAFCIDIE